MSIPQDSKVFRGDNEKGSCSDGKRETESFPGGQPLKNRVEWRFTTDKNYKVKDTVIVHTIEEDGGCN